MWPNRDLNEPDAAEEISLAEMPRETLIARVQELLDERQKLRDEIDFLSQDPDFGIMTRNAFVRLCHFMPRGVRIFAFLDFDDLKELNNRFGYSEVNDKIRETLAIPHRRSDLIARWFSGDEVVVLFDGDNRAARIKIEELKESARKRGLDFTYELGTWVVGSETIEEAVRRAANRVLEIKAEARTA